MNYVRNFSIMALVAITLSGCATTLKPAPGTQLVNNKEDAAVERTSDVEFVVDADAWSAFPRSLERKMTPMQVTITNNSDHPLEIMYENFSLNGVQGVTYHPLPPVDIKGTITQPSPHPVLVPRFVHRGFFVAPYYHPYLTGLPPWSYGWPSSPIYYQRYYPRWEIDLPTREMLELAIPEGVVEPNGQVSGFLYFPDLEAAEKGDQVTFAAKLVDARTDDSFGQVGIPFVLQ